MIKVLHKAFDFLELLAEEPEQQKTLGDIAPRLKLNASTCANILKTMVSRNYVEQIAPKKGYTLGPMAYHLTRNGPYRKDLILAAESLMTQLVDELKETVLLAILRQGKRFIISQIDGTQTVQVGTHSFFQEKVYQTATGRFLLAFLPEPELDAFVTTYGLPGKDWPEADSLSKLHSALADIRNKGWICHGSDATVTGIAFPIRQREKVVAALGLFLPTFRFKGHHKRTVLKGLQHTAKQISQQLSQ